MDPDDSLPGWQEATYEWTDTQTELWYAWAEIALEHEREAVTARQAAKEAVAGGADPSEAIARETKAAMVCVIAAGIMLETLGKNLARYVAPPVSARGAAGRLIATAQAVFPQIQLEGQRSAVMDVFTLRNATAHYVARWEPMTEHPLGMRTTQVAVTYSAEASIRAVDVILEVLRRTTRAGRSRSDEAEFWALQWRTLPDELQATRPERQAD